MAFSNKSGFPQIIGAIDGCHVAINRPKEDGDSYFNRKKFYFVVLQAVCKADRSFIDIDCRWPDSVHDGRVFRTFSVSQSQITKIHFLITNLILLMRSLNSSCCWV
jgi:hypothetical protein